MSSANGSTAYRTTATASTTADSIPTEQPSRARWRDVRSFLLEFARTPTRTASVLPSSRHLAEPMTTPVPERGHPVVVELGPGTGAFTAAIQRRLGDRGRHLALELNPRWAELLGSRYPGVDVVCANANDLPEVLADRGLAADVVVSGLPWEAYAGTAGGTTLVDKIAGTLTSDGVFTQFGYSWTRWAPPAKRQMAQLRAAFEETLTSRTVWRNVPPALVHVARRPR